MSLYREPGRRRAAPIVTAAVAFALLGGLAGFLIGSSGDEETSLEDALAQAQDDVRPALSELELVAIEYSEAVRDGRVVAETEYQASIDHVARSREVFEGVSEELRPVSPEEVTSTERHLEELGVAVERRAPTPQVTRLVGQTDAAIRAAALL
jgi:hypothetical protein